MAAAVNILTGRRARSIWWERRGPARRTEALLLVKTRRDQVAPVVARIKAEHGYICPSIAALPIEAGNPDYLDWIDRETKIGKPIRRLDQPQLKGRRGRRGCTAKAGSRRPMDQALQVNAGRAGGGSPSRVARRRIVSSMLRSVWHGS